MDVQFITSVAVITPDPSVSRRLYVNALGLALTAEGDGYLHSEDIDGCKSFGVWPLTQAAQACLGTPGWPVERPMPQAIVEFEVADAETVQAAADELKEKGFTLLHDARTEPWDRPSLDCSPARVRSSASPTRPRCISSEKERCPRAGPLTLQCSVGQADLAVGGDVRPFVRPHARQVHSPNLQLQGTHRRSGGPGCTP